MAVQIYDNIKCSSCGAPLTGKFCVVFKCPNCGIELIGRCAICRDQSVVYRCSECGFEGP